MLFYPMQLNQQVDDTVKLIVHLATRESSQADRVLKLKYQLTEWDCYEPAVELFDEHCFDISQVRPTHDSCHLTDYMCLPTPIEVLALSTLR